jgi:hypothetical protein
MHNGAGVSALSAGDRHAPKGHMATVSIWAVLPLGTDGSSSIGAQGMRSGTIASLRVSPWKNRSAHALAQDERSSAVYGMPKAAVENGTVQELLPLDKISLKLAENYSF